MIAEALLINTTLRILDLRSNRYYKIEDWYEKVQSNAFLDRQRNGSRRKQTVKQSIKNKLKIKKLSPATLFKNCGKGLVDGKRRSRIKNSPHYRVASHRMSNSLNN